MLQLVLLMPRLATSSVADAETCGVEEKLMMMRWMIVVPRVVDD